MMEESEAVVAGGRGCFLSAGFGGCLSSSATFVAASIGAGVSSEQIRRTAALKLPSSNLLVIAFASRVSFIIIIIK